MALRREKLVAEDLELGSGTVNRTADDGSLLVGHRINLSTFSGSLDPSAGNVMDYGALGDGVTDDSAAIQLAIAAGNIFFPPGTYVFSGIVPPSNRRIWGSGLQRTTWKMPNNVPNGTIMFDLQNVDNIDIAFAQVNGNIAGQPTKINGSGQIRTKADIGDYEQVFFIQALDTDKIHVHDMYAHHLIADFFLCRGDDIMVDHCVVETCGRNAVSIYGGLRWYIHDNSFTCSQVPIDLEPSPTQTIAELHIHDNYVACTVPRVSLNTANRLYGISIQNNLVDQTIRNVVVSGNTIVGTVDSGSYYPGIGIYIVDIAPANIAMNGITVTGNAIRSVPVGISDGQNLAVTTNPLTITGNALSDIRSDGIAVQFAVISGNTLHGGSGATRGIRVAFRRTSVVGNMISGWVNGIDLDDGTNNVLIAGNTIVNNSGYAIQSGSPSSGIVIVGNVMFSNTLGDVSLTADVRAAANVSDSTYDARYYFSTNFITSGSGTPEGSITAPIGSLYLRTAGGASTTLYVKESGAGNTGWAAK